MTTQRQVLIGWIALFAAAGLGRTAARAADAPTVEHALTALRPSQRDVEYETPSGDEIKKCRITVERSGKTSGWVIFGPNGQVLRRFVDSDGDNVVDQFRYYNHGLEVYRDIDTNNNHKADECRWLNTGGSRWGLDRDEDGAIDAWKVLSPEEAVREAVLAMIRQDDRRLAAVLATRDDLRAIGAADAYAAKIVEAVADPLRKIREVTARSKILNAQTTFVRADNLTPTAIPSEEGKLRNDVVVYENAMAIVETRGKNGLMQIGELVRVGDVWKLTQIPQPIEGGSSQVMAGGILMQPTVASSVAAPADVAAPSAEVQKILAELQKLDQASPAPTSPASKLTEYNAKRADILSRLVSASATDEERNQWMRQMIDSIASAVQIGAYSEGLARLKTLEADARRSTPKSPIVPYIVYRRLLAEYTTQHQTANNKKQQDIQKWWRGELEKFTKDYPAAEDAPEALLQLAISYEFIGQGADAKKWYGELAANFPQTRPGRRAAGALRRLDLKGKPLDFSGPSLEGPSISTRDYAGKVVLLVYWSTWCTTCTEDLPVLRTLYEQYRSKGLEIIGISLDVTAEPISPFLKQNRITWPQIYQPGGIESEPAAAFGIIVPPVMILADRRGKTVLVTTAIDEIKAAVPELLRDKKSSSDGSVIR